MSDNTSVRNEVLASVAVASGIVHGSSALVLDSSNLGLCRELSEAGMSVAMMDFVEAKATLMPEPSYAHVMEPESMRMHLLTAAAQTHRLVYMACDPVALLTCESVAAVLACMDPSVPFVLAIETPGPLYVKALEAHVHTYAPHFGTVPHLLWRDAGAKSELMVWALLPARLAGLLKKLMLVHLTSSVRDVLEGPIVPHQHQWTLQRCAKAGRSPCSLCGLKAIRTTAYCCSTCPVEACHKCWNTHNATGNVFHEDDILDARAQDNGAIEVLVRWRDHSVWWVPYSTISAAP